MPVTLVLRHSYVPVAPVVQQVPLKLSIGWFGVRSSTYVTLFFSESCTRAQVCAKSGKSRRVMLVLNPMAKKNLKAKSRGEDRMNPCHHGSPSTTWGEQNDTRKKTKNNALYPTSRIVFYRCIVCTTTTNIKGDVSAALSMARHTQKLTLLLF